MQEWGSLLLYVCLILVVAPIFFIPSLLLFRSFVRRRWLRLVLASAIPSFFVYLLFATVGFDAWSSFPAGQHAGLEDRLSFGWIESLIFTAVAFLGVFLIDRFMWNTR